MMTDSSHCWASGSSGCRNELSVRSEKLAGLPGHCEEQSDGPDSFSPARNRPFGAWFLALFSRPVTALGEDGCSRSDLYVARRFRVQKSAQGKNFQVPMTQSPA